MSITKRVFGRNAQGETVTQYILTNAMGAAIKVIDFGAILTSVTVPDRNGKLADVVTGFDDMEGYLKPHGSMARPSAATGTALRRVASPLTARPISWPSTTARTICTAARSVSAQRCGRRRSSPARARTA